MRIANIADPQIDGNNHKHAEAQFEALWKKCRHLNIDAFTIAGDIFEKPSIKDQSFTTGRGSSVAIHGVLPFINAGIPVYMVVGNHDVSGVGSDDALHIFDGMPLVSVAREPCIALHKNLIIAAFPWSWKTHDAEPDIRLLEELVEEQENILSKFGKPKPHTLLLGHVQVRNGAMNNGSSCPSSRAKYQVDKAVLDSLSFDHIALGDFHKRQPYFVGAFIQHNFGEEGNPAGFEIYDTETNETEWIELDAAPRYKTFVLDAGDPMPVISADDNMIFRIQIHGHVSDWSEVKRMESMGVQVDNILPRPERTQRADVKPNIIDDPHALFRLWAANRVPPLSEEEIVEHLKTYDEEFGDSHRTKRPTNSAAVVDAEQPGPETSQPAPVRAKELMQPELPF